MRRFVGVMRMRRVRNMKALTVIELLIGMLITSIVLAAVATIAFALSAASGAGDETALAQTRLRQATLRLGELIGTCKFLCAAPGNDLVLWRADDNDDNRINLNELVYLERGATGTELRLCQFSAPDNPEVTLNDLTPEAAKSQWVAQYGATYTTLIPECRDVAFAFYPAGLPLPQVRCLIISFRLREDGGDRPYEIVAALRSRAAHLLTAAGDALVDHDDD